MTIHTNCAGMTRRDQVAVERLSSGLIKLIYPDGRMTDEELQGYYAAHKEAYRDPEQRQIRYAAIPLQRFTQHYNPAAE